MKQVVGFCKDSGVGVKYEECGGRPPAGEALEGSLISDACGDLVPICAGAFEEDGGDV